MQTFTLTAQDVNGNPVPADDSIIIVNNSTTVLSFVDNDGTLGTPSPGDQVSVDGGPLQDYIFIGAGEIDPPGNGPNEPAAFIQLADGTTYAIDLSSGDAPDLPNGNSGLIPSELNVDATPDFPVDPDDPICFTPGTLLATPQGPRAVETLSPGDLVLTVDAGAQPVRWVGQTDHVWPGAQEKHKPIEIKAGALGHGLPERNMAVSPQHRMLMAGPAVAEMFDTPEVLALAKGLTGLRGVRVMQGRRKASYVSVLLDRHHVLIAEGAQTESFYPGPTALDMLSPLYATQVRSLFPALEEDPVDGYGPHARRVLTRRETEELVDALRASGFSGGDKETSVESKDEDDAHLSLVS